MPLTHWIGKLDQKTLVFDSSMQLPDCPHVFLWNTTSCSMEKYIPAVVRTLIQTNPDPEVSALAATAFETWKYAKAKDWLEEEFKYYAKRRAKEARENAARATKQERVSQTERAREELARLQRNRLAATREDARETLVERHQEALKATGGTYLGVRKQTAPRDRRVTHCYSCREHLDNSIDIECAACGWILCLCSACGCGYQREAY